MTKKNLNKSEKQNEFFFSFHLKLSIYKLINIVVFCLEYSGLYIYIAVKMYER